MYRGPEGIVHYQKLNFGIMWTVDIWVDAMILRMFLGNIILIWCSFKFYS